MLSQITSLKAIKYNAGISIVPMKKSQYKTVIRVWGNNTRYAPVTAATAPLAPKVGTFEEE